MAAIPSTSSSSSFPIYFTKDPFQVYANAKKTHYRISLNNRIMDIFKNVMSKEFIYKKTYDLLKIFLEKGLLTASILGYIRYATITEKISIIDGLIIGLIIGLIPTVVLSKENFLIDIMINLSNRFPITIQEQLMTILLVSFLFFILSSPFAPLLFFPAKIKENILKISLLIGFIASTINIIKLEKRSQIKWIEEKSRQLFCKTIMQNHLNTLDEKAKETFKSSIQAAFGNDAIDVLPKLVIESTLRSPTEINERNSPSYFKNYIKDIQELKTQWKRLSDEEKQKFSLLKDKEKSDSPDLWEKSMNVLHKKIFLMHSKAYKNLLLDAQIVG